MMGATAGDWGGIVKRRAVMGPPHPRNRLDREVGKENCTDMESKNTPARRFDVAEAENRQHLTVHIRMTPPNQFQACPSKLVPLLPRCHHVPGRSRDIQRMGR